MSHPLVIAYHLIWTAYGWWLPNDPRGSGSTTVRSDVLAELGELHYGRKRVQPAGRVVREFYEEAKAQLKHPLLTFDAQAREVIADSFATTITKQNYTCYACVIMPGQSHVALRGRSSHSSTRDGAGQCNQGNRMYSSEAHQDLEQVVMIPSAAEAFVGDAQFQGLF